MTFIKRMLAFTMVLSVACSLIACGKNEPSNIGSSISKPANGDNKSQEDYSSEFVPSPEYKLESIALSEIVNAISNEYGKIDDFRRTVDFEAYSCYAGGKIFMTDERDYSSTDINDWYYFDIGPNKKIIMTSVFGGVFANEDGSLTAYSAPSGLINYEHEDIKFMNLPCTKSQFITCCFPFGEVYVLYEDNGKLVYSVVDENEATPPRTPLGSVDGENLIELSYVNNHYRDQACVTADGVYYDAEFGYHNDIGYILSLSAFNPNIPNVDKVLTLHDTANVFLTKNDGTSNIYYYGIYDEDPEWEFTLPDNKSVDDIVYFDGEILVFSDGVCYNVSTYDEEIGVSELVTNAVAQYGLDNMVVHHDGKELMFFLDNKIYKVDEFVEYNP